MSRKDVEKFLMAKNSQLYFYEALTKEGRIRTAAQIIHSAGSKWHISKRFMLVLLQKEQGLITEPEPTPKMLDWATGYAVCDSCGLDDPKIQRWKGFAQQVNSAAAQFRDYFDNADQYAIKIGQPLRVDGQEVIPQNQATANLYLYTPHLLGNQNFAKIWNSWFGDGTDMETQSPHLPYPDGSLLQPVGEKDVWYISQGKRRQILSRSVLNSRFDKKKIITVSLQDLEKFPNGAPIQFHQYALVRDEQGTIYLIVGDKKRPLENDEVFRKLGYNPEEVISGTSEELSVYSNGLPITQNLLDPTGELFQNKDDGQLFYVESETKYPIVDRRLISLRFKGKNIKLADSSELASYTAGKAYPVADGELVRTRGDATIYVISNGHRLPIKSQEVFKKLGYKFENVLRISKKLLEIHPLGEEITGE